MLSFRISAAILLILLSLETQAWDNHKWITQEALSALPDFKGSTSYAPLDEALAKSTLPYRNTASLLRTLKLNTHFRFESRLGEKAGMSYSITDVISAYSDEPDWGCDQNLFEPDEYPELWTKDTAYISKKNGLGSQGFRHMFFPGHWSWKEPISSFQLPSHPLGEAPERAQLFLNLALPLLEEGKDYWGYRFLAWSLHFVEDLYQPFHSRQIPSRKFIRIKWRYLIPSLDIPASTEQIVYYHLSYERWMSEEMAPADSELRKALRGTERGVALTTPYSDYVKQNVVAFSSTRASTVGSKMTQIFPKYVPQEGENAEQFVQSDRWSQTLKKPGPMKPLLETTNEIFTEMGKTIRSWVSRTPKKSTPSPNSKP